MKGTIVSPAKKIESKILFDAKEILENKGMSISINTSSESENYFAGEIDFRTQQVQQAIHSDTDFIWMSRGGYGCIHLIEHLDFSNLKDAFKWIIGFSDVTYFHCYLNQVLGLPSIHGTMPLNFADNSDVSIQSVINIVKGEGNYYEYTSSPFNQAGTAEGKVVGGNLAILAAVSGTDMQVNTDNKILFFEDVGEHLYQIDRMLYTLKFNGQLKDINGLIVGGLTNMSDTQPPFGKKIEEIILSHVEKDIPVCFDFPAGHVDDNRAVGLNMHAILEVDSQKVKFVQQ